MKRQRNWGLLVGSVAMATLAWLALLQGRTALAEDDGKCPRYAAIALDDFTGSYGYAYNYSTRKEAEEAAIRWAGRNARVILSTTAPYFAFARGPLGGWGTGTGNTYWEAATAALVNARKHALSPQLKFCRYNGPDTTPH
ncbi:hypothetical protein THTE_2942 [Thermogutta terrifontis]|jgi:hypothetical protein|uniref:DUF4189 domain-containing protein n=1 Tax=Thermogutta terrifontis TaxID=1331910 RepID=A0A286RHU6_9BACT|nr:DUF4189 domain-containing protein [Thermogutta terrifontis]ASV75544.1 hypothetical protein THTE_2942 [Thermogutta terrifontis]